MSFQWMLYRADNHWHIDRMTSSTNHDRYVIPVSGDDRAASGVALLDEMRARGYDGRGVLLALPTNECLSATFPRDHAHSIADRESLAYAFENSLPLPAEEMISDFIAQRSSTVLGVAIETAEHAPWLDALEQAGIAVDYVVPLSLLAIQRWANTANDAQQNSSQVVVWRHDEQAELFQFQAGKLTHWNVVPCRTDGMARQIRAMLPNSEPSQLIPLDIPLGDLQSFRHMLPNRSWVEPHSPCTMSTLAAQQAYKLLASHEAPLDPIAT